jgi:hypothetical protein
MGSIVVFACARHEPRYHGKDMFYNFIIPFQWRG